MLTAGAEGTELPRGGWGEEAPPQGCPLAPSERGPNRLLPGTGCEGRGGSEVTPAFTNERFSNSRNLDLPTGSHAGPRKEPPEATFLPPLGGAGRGGWCRQRPGSGQKGTKSVLLGESVDGCRAGSSGGPGLRTMATALGLTVQGRQEAREGTQATRQTGARGAREGRPGSGTRI